MHAGRNYSFKEVVIWTRRDIFLLFIISCIPTLCFSVVGLRWLSFPWVPIALIGTAVAFIIGFKNNASYDRMWEARRAWGGIVNASRSWGIMVLDYVNNKHTATPLSQAELHEIHCRLVYRHLAWLTALRYQLREARTWESAKRAYNVEYQNKYYSIAEHSNTLAQELGTYLPEHEVQRVLSVSNKAAHIIVLQSEHLRHLYEAGLIDSLRHIEFEKMLGEFYNHQGTSERIKNFPYPRQFATLNLYFVRIFVLLIPFGMLHEFEKLGDAMVWLTVPFSTLVSWIFTTLEKIGEATENPFEGAANDVPITAMSRSIEIDLREMLKENNIPSPLQPHHNILL